MHNLSLVLFTCLSQAAVGMILLLALLPAKAETGIPRSNVILDRLHMPEGFAIATALVLLGLGVLFSLLHLSDPFISFYSIANIATSWLSREILFVGFFGFATLALFFFRNRALGFAAAIFGLGLVYVMSNVYMTPPVPFWKTPATLWVFLSTCLLLGSATLLLVRTYGNAGSRLLPVIVVIAAGLRLIFGFWQVTAGPAAISDVKLLYVHLGCTVLALVILFRMVQYRQKDAGETSASRAPASVFAVALLLWIAEISARFLFYDAMSSFTM